MFTMARIYAKYLCAEELQYELRIRGLAVGGNAHDARSVLSPLFRAGVDANVYVSTLEYDADKAGVLKTMNRIRLYMSEQTLAIEHMLRVQSIAIHVRDRIKRMRYPTTVITDEMKTCLGEAEQLIKTATDYFEQGKVDLEKTYPDLHDLDDQEDIDANGAKPSDSSGSGTTSTRDETEAKKLEAQLYDEFLAFRKKVLLAMVENPDVNFPIESLQFTAFEKQKKAGGKPQDEAHVTIEDVDDEPLLNSTRKPQKNSPPNSDTNLPQQPPTHSPNNVRFSAPVSTVTTSHTNQPIYNPYTRFNAPMPPPYVPQFMYGQHPQNFAQYNPQFSQTAFPGNNFNQQNSNYMPQTMGQQSQPNSMPHNNISRTNGVSQSPSPIPTNNNDISQMLANALQMRPQGSTLPISKWPFYFDGSKAVSDGKALELFDFIDKIEEYQKGEGITDEQMLARVHCLLRGNASTWFLHKRKQINSWADFQTQIKERFTEADNKNALLCKIFTRKQQPGESTLAFADEMSVMMDRLPGMWDDKGRVDNIVRGLRPDVQKLARTNTIPTVSALTTFIKQVFGSNDVMYARKTMPVNNERFQQRKINELRVENQYESDVEEGDPEECFLDYEDVSELNAISKNSNNKQLRANKFPNGENTFSQAKGAQQGTLTRQRSMQTESKSYSKTSPMNKQSAMAEIQHQTKNNFSYEQNKLTTADLHCKNCGQNGHFWKNCTKERVIHCWYCGKPGVIASNCDCQKNKNAHPGNSKVSEIVTTTEETGAIIDGESTVEMGEIFIDPIFHPQPDGRPHIMVKVQGTAPLLVILDSGAQATVIGRNHFQAIKEFQALPMRPCFTTISTADRTKHFPIGELDVEYTVEDKRRKVTTIVANMDIAKPLFGMNFQEAFTVRLVMMDVIDLKPMETPQKFVNEKHELTVEQQKILDDTVALFPFSKPDGPLNCSPFIEHTIDTGDHAPICQMPYEIPPARLTRAKTEIDRMLNREIIEPLKDSAWNLPIICVEKPNNKVRICLDARKLNKITRPNKYYQTNLARIFARMKRGKYISCCDVNDAFYQINLAENAREKCSFIAPGIGRFAYKRMPAGLKNSCSTLCQLVDSMFTESEAPEIFVYLDDFLIISPTFESHIKSLKFLAERLVDRQLTVSGEKSEFGLKKCKWLGQIFSEEGIEVDPSRIAAIANFRRPRTSTEIKSFLGLCGFYRRYIHNFSGISAGMSELLKGCNQKRTPIKWNELAEISFITLKQALISSPILQPPEAEYPFTVEVSNNGIAIAGILSQSIESKLHVIAYTSAKLTDSQRKFSNAELDCLAIIHAVETWDIYIAGSKIEVQADAQNVKWLQNRADKTGRLSRWGMRMQAYDMEIIQRKSKRKYINTEVLCEAITEDTPFVNLKGGEDIIDLNFEFDCDETDVQMLEIKCDQEVLLVNVSDFKATEDDWYLQKFNESNSLPNFKVENDILYYKYDYKLKPFELEWKIVVPIEFIHETFVQEHEETISSHGGFYRTYRRMREKYYFPKMYDTVYKLVKDCVVCRITKASTENTKALMGSQRTPTENFQHIFLDFVGPLVMSKKQNSYLLVAVDSLSKYVFAKPMQSATAEVTIKFLINEIVLKVGVPEYFIVDNAKVFTGLKFTKFCESLNIKLMRTANYSPQANATEAVNKVIGNAIRAYLTKCPDQTHWCNGIPEIIHALNSAVHSQSNCTPNMAVFGKNIVRDGREYRYLYDSQPNQVTHDKRTVINQHIRQCLKKSYETAKKNYNTRAKPRNFKVGDVVYIKNHRLSNAGNRYSKKLAPKKRQVRVAKRIGNVIYELHSMRGENLGNHHAKDIYTT